MLVRIKKTPRNIDPIGRKMRADAPVFSSGVASFPRVEAEKDPELYARWESLTIAYLKGNTGIISVRFVMHNDEEQPHLHFSYAPIPKLMPRHYITDTRQKRIS